VGKAWECSSTQAVEFVLQEHDLFLLLLDDVEQLPLVGDISAHLFGALLAGCIRVRLQVVDLLTLLHIMLEHTRLLLESLVLRDLLTNFLLELADLSLGSLHTLSTIVLKVLGLSVKVLLVLFLLLDVLALDNLLRLLRHTVKLDVKGTLLEILDLKTQFLVLK